MLLANKLMRDAAKLAVKQVDAKVLKDDPVGIDKMLAAMKAEAKEVLGALIERRDPEDVQAMTEKEVLLEYQFMVITVALAGVKAVGGKEVVQ